MKLPKSMLTHRKQLKFKKKNELTIFIIKKIV